MPLRIAAIASFVVFAVCLIVGAENTFSAAVERALVAMMATLVSGLIVGWMGQKMIEENVNQRVKAAAEAAKPPEEAVQAMPDNKGAKTAGKKGARKTERGGR